MSKLISTLESGARAEGFVSAFTISPTGDADLILICTVPEVGQVRVKCREVLEVQLRAPNLSGEIVINSDDPLLLDYGPFSSVMGNAPIPDPHRFFVEFHELIREQFGSCREPERYLNWRGSFKEWRFIAVQRMYLLLTAPVQIAKLAGTLLEHQAAEFIILPEEKVKPRPASAIRIGEGWIVASAIDLEPA